MRKEWYDQLPVIAALCYSAQDDPDTREAVREALEIVEHCEGVDMAWKAEQNRAAFEAETIDEELAKDKGRRK